MFENTTASRVNSGMIAAYLMTFVALFYTGVVSFLVSNLHDPFFHALTGGWSTIIEIGILFYTIWMLNTARSEGNIQKMTVLFGVLCTVWGIMLGVVFAVYTAVSIFQAFFSASALFLVMSGWAYFSKRDVSSIGSYLMVGLSALIIVSLVNLFVGSSELQMLLSAVAILLFLAITAWDAQTIRNNLWNAESKEEEDLAITGGAVSLYMDFLNIFINILSLFGVPKVPRN